MLGPSTVLAAALMMGAAVHDDPAAVSEKIAAFEAAGKFSRAASMAEELAERYPQDYGVVLWAGWLRFQARHYRRASAHYERAVELSFGSLESRLGLAWSRLYDGRRRRAIRDLEDLEREFPNSEEVAKALAFARKRSPVAVTPWVSGTAHVYGDHPELRNGFGVQGGVGITIAEHVAVAASYGYARIGFEPEPADTTVGFRGSGGPGGSGGAGGGNDNGMNGAMDGGADGAMNQYGRRDEAGVGGTAVEQHQVHASIGAVYPIAGVVAQYGFLRDEGFESIHAAGLSLRYSPWGDILLNTSVTFEPELVRPRFEPSWKAPVHENVWLRPALSVQTDRNDALVSGALTIGIEGRPGAAWLGGKYGRERRPAYLDVPVIFNLAGDLRYGAWLGGRVRLPYGFAVFGGYELYGIEAYALSGPTDALAHYVTLGLSLTHA